MQSTFEGGLKRCAPTRFPSQQHQAEAAMQIKNVFIVNLWGKAYSGFSKGELNKSFCALAQDFFKGKGCDIKTTNVCEDYEVEKEIEKYQWADFVFYQSPTNWMVRTSYFVVVCP